MGEKHLVANHRWTVKRCHVCQQVRRVAAYPWMRAVRKHAHLSLREIARRANCSASYICDIELGRRTANERILEVYETLENGI